MKNYQMKTNGMVYHSTQVCETNKKWELATNIVAAIVVSSVTTGIACLGYRLKTDYKRKSDADLHREKCKIDIEKYKTMNDIKKQYKERENQEVQSTDEDTETVWEDFNDAVYGHTNEKHFWLMGNVINMGGTHLIIGAKSIGKTILVTTLANAISKGIEYRLFVSDNANPCHQPPQQVFLYDLEMQYSDLNKRNGKHGYSFSNISRCDQSSFTVDSWLRNVKKVIDGLTSNATIILDNITRLESDTSQPIVGKKLFDGIKSLKNAAKVKGVIVTFILIAHTTNNRNDYDPITLKDAACADTLTTGMDSISMLGVTRDTGKMLFKAYRLRHSQTPSEVTILEPKDKPFLRFEIAGLDKESNVLPLKNPVRSSKPAPKSAKKSKEEEFLQKARKAQELISSGMTKEAAAKKVHISRPTLDVYLKKLSK